MCAGTGWLQRRPVFADEDRSEKPSGSSPARSASTGPRLRRRGSAPAARGRRVPGRPASTGPRLRRRGSWSRRVLRSLGLLASTGPRLRRRGSGEYQGSCSKSAPAAGFNGAPSSMTGIAPGGAPQSRRGARFTGAPSSQTGIDRRRRAGGAGRLVASTGPRLRRRGSVAPRGRAREVVRASTGPRLRRRGSVTLTLASRSGINRFNGAPSSQTGIAFELPAPPERHAARFNGAPSSQTGIVGANDVRRAGHRVASTGPRLRRRGSR